VTAREGPVTYTLKASKNGTEVRRKLNVWTREPIFGQVTVTPSPVIAGESAELCARVLDASSVKDMTISPAGEFVGDSGVRNALGLPTLREYCFRIKPTERTTYTFTATSPSGQRQTRQITVEVKQPTSIPRIKSFTASPSAVASGEQVQLCYEVENADGVTFSWSASEKTSRLIKVSERYKTALIIAQTKPSSQQGPSQPRSPLFVKGSKNCVPFGPTRTTTYAIKATNNSGEDSKSITVTVQEKPQRNDGPQQSAQSPSQPSGGSSTTGSLEGMVVDTSLQPMANVVVTATNALNGNKYSTRTDEKGSFLLPFLPPGNYKVTASMRGYSNTTITVRVPLNATTIIKPPNITLRRADSNSNK